MKRIHHILLTVALLLVAMGARAQYYTWGSDSPSLKWHSVKSDDVKIIYPDTARGYALRTLFCIEQIKPSIGYGFRHPAMPIPFVMHSENFQSNGLVMWLPKRVEFLTSPAVGSYSMPWYKQLTAHEYRHAVQYNNLNRGVIKALSYLLGQQGSTVGLLFLPIWLIEGDAVMAETEMSTFGRGLQPRFSLEYRALGREMLRRKNCDKWFCGSYVDFIPDHYQLGYQIASYSYTHYGENIWDKVAWYSVRNPYMIFTTSIALKKFYKTDVQQLFEETFTDLNNYWDALPEVEPSTRPLMELPERNHLSYQWPVIENDSTAITLKSAMNRPTRFVRIDLKRGTEERMAYTGALSTRPALGENGRLWWTEYRRSKLFEQRVGSYLCYMDLERGRPRTVKGVRNALYATPTDEGIGWIEYTPDGRYTLVIRENGGEERHTLPHFKEVHGLAWDNLTDRFYLLITDDDGMWIASLHEGHLEAVTRGAYITLSDLSARDGRLYYGSIRSGRDEAHCFDLERGEEIQLTTSRYGAFSPVAKRDGEVIVSDYTARGYRLALQPPTEGEPLAYASTPTSLVNPPRAKWEVINLDTVRFTSEDSLRMSSEHRHRRYRKGLNLFKIHSWMPLALNPFDLVDEHNVKVDWGITLLSQNLLSNTEAYALWGWNRSEGSLYRLGIRYFGLGVHLNLEGAYGGNQMIYSLAQKNPTTNEIETQERPSPETYYSIGASATLPLLFQRGYHTRQLSLGVGWSYSNGLVANVGAIRYDKLLNTITNLAHIGYMEGLHKLQFSVGFSDQVRMAPREFVPRWGYQVALDYSINPASGSFSDLVSIYGRAYLPGIVRPHALTVALNYQTSIGGFHTPDGRTMLTYKSTRLIPAGYTSESILSDNYTAASVAYQLPIWYPEGGISSVIYFKRIRLNVGVDYAQFRVGNQWRRLYSYGGDLLFDVNIFRQPASATSTVKLSLYKPRHGSLWFGMGVGLPF
uniref:hypothetical protein n=1 Tax=Alistipes sp. TaxID=1872444 RepID=UPI004055D724